MRSRDQLPPGDLFREPSSIPRRRRDPIWPLLVLLVAACITTASFVLLPQAMAPPAPAVEYVLLIDSEPKGIHFQLDGISYTTPNVQRRTAGPHTILMPRYVVIGDVTYNFQTWGDGETLATRRNATRILNLQADTSLSSSFDRPVAEPVVASDSYVGVLSLSTNGGHKFLADSRGKLIVVYINGLGAIAVTVNNGDPKKDPWMAPVTSPRGFLRPAAVLWTDDEMHILAEYQSNVTEVVVHFGRDAEGNITDATFGPPVKIAAESAYPSAIRAHDGSIWAAWSHRDPSGGSFAASRLIAGHWTPASGWESQEIAVDATNTEPFFPVILERPDNFKLYVFANRGQNSADRSMAFVSATFSSGTWAWRPPSLTYETIASRGIVDAVDAAWDPVRRLVVVVNDHTGTPSYLAFSLDANDVKTRFSTPDFIIANNDWGAIFVDSVTGDYYLLFMETYPPTVNGRACYTRWDGTRWSDFIVIDQHGDDLAFQTRSGGGPIKDFIFGRGTIPGSVEIHYGRFA